MDEMLSAHVSRAEFEHSATAIAHGIANVMGGEDVRAAQALCREILEPVRAHFGRPMTINSGYRCPKVNLLVGSRPGSQHERGEAADHEIDGVANVDLARYIAGSTLDFDQLILEAYDPGQARSGWVHVSHKLIGHGRRSMLTMVMGSHGPVYLKGIVA